MTPTASTPPPPLALVTGAAKRIGRCISEQLHQAGYNLIIHYQHSHTEAAALCEQLNAIRPNSAQCHGANLAQREELEQLISFVHALKLPLALLVNNASVFHPTPLSSLSNDDWDNIINVNLRAPLLLAQGLHEQLRQQGGAIVNLVDIYADKPLADHVIYNTSKAGMEMLTKSLAQELAPDVRVNGVSPGAILWPEQNQAADYQDTLLEKVALKRRGQPQDIAATVLFLAQAPYITGQVIKVDGGRSLTI